MRQSILAISHSVMTICWQLKKAQLSATIHPSITLHQCPSLSVSCSAFQSFHQPGDSFVLALSMIHCSLQSLSTVSSVQDVYRMTRKAARQTDTEFHLSFIPSLPACRHFSLSLPQKRAFSPQPAQHVQKVRDDQEDTLYFGDKKHGVISLSGSQGVIFLRMVVGDEGTVLSGKLSSC